MQRSHNDLTKLKMIAAYAIAGAVAVKTVAHTHKASLHYHFL